MKNIAAAIAMLTVLASGLAQASQRTGVNYRVYGFKSEAEMVNYFTIAQSEITEVKSAKDLSRTRVTKTAAFDTTLTIPTPVATPSPTPIPTPAPSTIPSSPSVKTGNPVIDVLLNPGMVDAWVTIGMKVWTLISANRPVANVSTQRFAVMPSASIEWSQMSNWKGPAAHTFSVKKKNMFGTTIIENTYTVAYNYNGQVNGKGAFLANATIIPSNIAVAFGFQLNSDAQAGQPLNMGSMEAPVAGIELQVRWKADSFLNHQEGVDAFFLKGDGEMTKVNTTNSEQVNAQI